MLYNTLIVDEINRRFLNGEIVKRDETPYYRNEIGVKKAFIKFVYTDDETEEFIKCKNDILYFAEEYCKVRREDGSIGQIKLIEYQKNILKDINSHKFILHVKSRQIGSSLINAIKIIHFIIFNNDKNVMIVSNLRDTSVEILDKVKKLYINLPFFLKPGIKNWNIKSIFFDNGCKIRTASRSKTPPIGSTIDFIYIDEFAHIPSNIIEPYYAAIYPIISSKEDSKLIISSTPNGSNLFYKLFLNSKEDADPINRNCFKLIETPYSVIPERDLKWVEKTTKDIGGEDIFQEEYNLRFFKEDKVSKRLDKIESTEDELSNRLDRIEKTMEKILDTLKSYFIV